MRRRDSKSKGPGEEPRVPRVRRTADQARTAMLDAAQRRLIESGPSAIRLKEVAEDVGVSHPTVLHHFGSRDRLVDEVIERRVASMEQDVLDVIASGLHSTEILRELYARLASSFGEGGHARVMAFLALEGRKGPMIDGVAPLAHALHAKRSEICAARGERAPDFDDTFFTVVLATLVLFGDAIAGPVIRGDDPTAPESESGPRFREWFVSLLQSHLDAPGLPASPAPDHPRKKI